MPNSWKLVMLPVPRTLFCEIIASAPCCGVRRDRSVNITVMSDKLLVPYIEPRPGPSSGVPTAPPWQMLQVTLRLPVQVPSLLRNCVTPIGN